MDNPINAFIGTGFIALTVVFFALLIRELRKALAQTRFSDAQQKSVLRRLVMGLILWAGIVSVWSVSGRMSDFTLFPFNLMPVMVIPLITIIVITFSKTSSEIIPHLDTVQIVRLQGFRVLVEILLWALYVRNLAPVQMTFEGRNFDVISGITALMVAYGLARKRVSNLMLVTWNLACLGLLINIVAIAILSMPSPVRQFHNDPANTIVTQFPYSWLPAFLVPLAYGLHFLSLRQVALQRHSSRTSTEITS